MEFKSRFWSFSPSSTPCRTEDWSVCLCVWMCSVCCVPCAVSCPVSWTRSILFSYFVRSTLWAEHSEKLDRVLVCMKFDEYREKKRKSQRRSSKAPQRKMEAKDLKWCTFDVIYYYVFIYMGKTYNWFHPALAHTTEHCGPVKVSARLP